MMTQIEFCERANGKPWVNRAEGPNDFDCWGLVLSSFREIDGVELPQFTGYADKECSTSDAANTGDMSLFKPSQPCNGAIMGMFDNKGRLLHVGRCLAGRVLHATSGLGVRWDTYQAITKRYSNVRYFTYEPK